MLLTERKTTNFSAKNVCPNAIVRFRADRRADIASEIEGSWDKKEISQTVRLNGGSAKGTCRRAETLRKKRKADGDIFYRPTAPVRYRMCLGTDRTFAALNTVAGCVRVEKWWSDRQSSNAARPKGRESYRKNKGQRSLASSRTSRLRKRWK